MGKVGSVSQCKKQMIYVIIIILNKYEKIKVKYA